MIQLTDNVIMLVDDDGAKTSFETDELQSRIITSALAAGTRDLAFAEDIALAIEYALSRSPRNPPTYARGDVDAVVAKALREAGFPRVANHFERDNGVVEGEVRNDDDSVRAIIAGYLALSGEGLDGAVRRVRSALDKLNMKRLAPTLVLELGKHYQTAATAVSPPLTPPRRRVERRSIQSILDRVPADAARWIQDGSIGVHAVSDLFPALKIDVNLKIFAETAQLTPPFTEMALLPAMSPLVGTINALAEAVARDDAVFAEKPLVYLRLTEIESFSADCLGADWPESRPLCEEIAAALVENVAAKVFKTKFV